MELGAYAVERDYSHYVAYASKTIFAVVSTASKGPVGVATVCTTAQDLVNKFGPLRVDSYGLYAGQYYLSQASKLYFVRAASSSALESSTLISGLNISSVSVSDALKIKAIDVGTYYDGYKIYLTKITTTTVVDDTDTVKITVLTETPTNNSTGGSVLSQSSVESTRTKVLEDTVGTITSHSYTINIKNKSGVTVETIKDIKFEDMTLGYKTNYIEISSVNSTSTELDAGVYTLAGGNDGIADITAADYINAANALRADTVDMNLFAVPGVSDASVITAMLALAENRGDCLFLVDPPADLTRDGVIAWHNGGGDYEHAAFNSSFGALYYDWVTIYDSVNKIKIKVPPSVVVSASIAYSDRTTEIWYAPAGLNRGLVRGVLDSVTKLNKSDVKYLYSGENAINSLYDDPQVGLVLWGQKTLLRENTALNRVNVRRLLNYLKRIITAACNYLTFDPNDRITWNSFEMKIIPTLKNIQDKRGIYGYRIIKGETIVTEEDIDNYRMPCMVMIRPTKSAEEIPIYFVLTSTGADFNEVLEANGVVTD